MAQAEKAQSEPSADSIAVMIVEDSTIVRALISRWVEAEEGMHIAARCRDGLHAVKDIARVKPDVIVLDIEMPNMDGLTALPKLIQAAPGAKVVMASTLTRRNAEISLKALSLGASDYVAKPESSKNVASSEQFRTELMGKIRGLAGGKGGAAAPAIPKGASKNIELRKRSNPASDVIAIGSSTGGPQALGRVLTNLTKLTELPILITQHMPPTFTSILAGHLAKATGWEAAEGVDGEVIKSGRIYVAPGDFHMLVETKSINKVIKLTQTPQVNFCRPAVDPMFESIAKEYGPRVTAVVLTGMGHDGAEGGKLISDKGGAVIAQDEETSVVWGMPGALSMTGACHAVCPLEQVAAKAAEYAKGNKK